MVVEQDVSLFPQDRLLDWANYDLAELNRLKSEYEHILRRSPREWRKYRKRAMLATQIFPVPKGRPGRPRDVKAEDYAARDPSKSYRQMAKEELRPEPEGEAKKLLVDKEGERIRASVRRSRRRKNT